MKKKKKVAFASLKIKENVALDKVIFVISTFDQIYFKWKYNNAFSAAKSQSNKVINSEFPNAAFRTKPKPDHP